MQHLLGFFPAFDLIDDDDKIDGRPSKYVAGVIISPETDEWSLKKQ